MDASIVRIATNMIDIKIRMNDQMHLLQWRRKLFSDEVLLDGKCQQVSRGLFGRETIYGLVFGRDDDGNGGKRVMLVIDPEADWTSVRSWLYWSDAPGGVRLEAADEVILAYGTLDERQYDQPADFSEWMKKTMGIKW